MGAQSIGSMNSAFLLERDLGWTVRPCGMAAIVHLQMGAKQSGSKQDGVLTLVRARSVLTDSTFPAFLRAMLTVFAVLAGVAGIGTSTCG